MVVKHLGIDPEKCYTLARIQKEIRQRGCGQLAKDIGISRQELQRIASGKREPSGRILQLIGVRRFVLYANASDAKEFESQAAASSSGS